MIGFVSESPISADRNCSIIAVPGLGSNVDWSWTWRDEGRHVNWLSDTNMLPAVVPKSRIVVYNYDSKWHSKAPKTRLQLCGEDLIRNLHNFRSALVNRPIIFIGHSLGGNVIQHVRASLYFSPLERCSLPRNYTDGLLLVEQAILYANSETEFTYMPKLITGLIFLGSPFRGSEMQRYAYFVARIMSPAGSHTGIIDDLGYDSPAMTDKLYSFCRLREKMHIPVSCFFELYATNYGKKISVPLFAEGMVRAEAGVSVSLSYLTRLTDCAGNFRLYSRL